MAELSPPKGCFWRIRHKYRHGHGEFWAVLELRKRTFFGIWSKSIHSRFLCVSGKEPTKIQLSTVAKSILRAYEFDIEFRLKRERESQKIREDASETYKEMGL